MERLWTGFKMYERHVPYFNQYTWKKGVTKEMVDLRNKKLLETAQNMWIDDLIILYYIRNLDRYRGGQIAKALQKAYQAQCELYNKLSNTDKYKDPFFYFFN